MATKNKKDTVTDLLANIFDNVVKAITPTRVKTPFNDIINSVGFNVTIAQLRLEDDSAEHSSAHIMDVGKQGVFYYDSADITSADDGVTVIKTSTNKRYKRSIGRKFDARWTGLGTPYFTSVANANAAIPAPVRIIGLEVDILIGGGTLSTYWYRDGTGDANLIIKSADIQVVDFTVGDGGTYTPADGATVLTNPALINRSILMFSYQGSPLKVTIYPATIGGLTDTYAQFDNTVGSVYLVNGQYNTDGHGLIIYK